MGFTEDVKSLNGDSCFRVCKSHTMSFLIIVPLVLNLHGSSYMVGCIITQIF